MYITTHRAVMPASQRGSNCLHHLKSLGSCRDTPTICKTGLAAATDCTLKHQPIRGAYGTSCEPISERAAAARGKRLWGHPKEDPGGGMEKGMLWGHSWRFTLGRSAPRCRRHLWVCTPSGKAHAGAEMPLKGLWPVRKPRAELRKWVKKTSKRSKKKYHCFLILTCVTQHPIKGTEHNMKWRQREWRPWRRQERCQKWSWVQGRGRKRIFPKRFFFVLFVSW